MLGKTGAVAAAFVLWAQPSLVEAQSVNLVERELQALRQSLFRLGPLYVTPSFQLSTGYDSNALSTPAADSDVTARAGPAVRLALPLGEVAFFDLTQEIDYVYYREQIDLRRWFDLTRLEAGLGGRRFLFKVTDEFRDETGRPTSEFDFPVQQRSNLLQASLDLALGWRHTVSFGYGQSRFEIREGLEDGAIAARLNRVQDRAYVELDRRLTVKTSAVAEAFYEQLAFDDFSRDAGSYGARFGFAFDPSGGDPLAAAAPLVGSFLNGRFLLGFRKVEPRREERVDYAGIIGSADVVLGLGDGHRLGGLFSRDIVPSVFEENWYFVETRWGASFTYQITRRFSATPGVAFGRNRYPLPGTGGEGEEEIFDRHRTVRLALDFRVTEHWAVGVSTEYLERESNVRLFGKDRLQVGLRMSFQP